MATAGKEARAFGSRMLLHLAARNSNREQAKDPYFFVHRSTQSLTVL
jgi:hypothetical protein